MFCRILTVLIFVFPVFSESIPEYTIVIDPGHGGVNQKPYKIYGDKYDAVSQEYLEPYKPGASYKGRKEKEIVLALGKEVKKILDLTKTPVGFEKFKQYVKIFSNDEIRHIRLNTHLTRKESYNRESYRGKDDKNRKYRLYDFPDFRTGKMQPGRLSQINNLKPYLVLSLHLNPSFPGHPGGMAAVISPSYRTFSMLRDISDKKIAKEKFESSPWAKWMVFKTGWDRLENAIADAWIYFHGYWPDKTGTKTNIKDFEGYRFNMIDWAYREDNWIEKAGKNTPGPYAKTHEDFRAENTFWDRERAKPEHWRREDGEEGFGGDNLFAATELMRYVQYGVRKQLPKIKGSYVEMGPINDPYISTYSVPTFINAISAYLEIGYIDQKRDMEYIVNRRKEVAISLAVGIYSLFHGLAIIPDTEMQILPKGKILEFEKYEKYEGGNYFNIVTKKR